MWARWCWKCAGKPKCLDLVASRRLALRWRRKAASPLFLLREGATPEPSAALTRWQVQSAVLADR